MALALGVGAAFVAFNDGATATRIRARLGDGRAAERLSRWYYSGYAPLGIEKDVGRAVEWATVAAEAGNARAMKRLGHAYAFGRGVEDQNHALALAWYKRAAEAGDAEAARLVAHKFRDGYGVDRDLSAAVSWLRRAAEAGNERAIFEFAGILAGEGPALTPAEERWIREAGIAQPAEAASMYRSLLHADIAAQVDVEGRLVRLLEEHPSLRREGDPEPW